MAMSLDTSLFECNGPDKLPENAPNSSKTETTLVRVFVNGLLFCPERKELYANLPQPIAAECIQDPLDSGMAVNGSTNDLALTCQKVAVRVRGTELKVYRRRSVALAPKLIRVIVKVSNELVTGPHTLTAIVSNSTQAPSLELAKIMPFVAPKRGRNRSTNPGKRAQQRMKVREKIRIEKAIEAKTIADLFPSNLLKIMVDDSVGQPNADYGKKQATLNFKTNELKKESGRFGQVSLGWMYDADQKMVTHPGHSRCKASERSLNYLTAVRRSLSKIVDERILQTNPRNISIMDTLRISAVRGAQTREHTDSLRGITPAYVMFHETGGRLQVRTFPSFRTMVVLLRGNAFIPFSFSSFEGLHLLGFADDGATAQRFEFPPEAIDLLQPYGNLNCAVVGIKNGALQVIPLEEKFTIFDSPTSLPTITMENAVNMAASIRTVKPCKPWHYLSRPHVWHEFEAWRFVHCWSKSSNHLIARTHAFFRPLRQVPTGANYIRVGKFINFVSVSDVNEVTEGSLVS